MPLPPFKFPFDPNVVHELVLVWVALGALLSLVVQRDLERARYTVSLFLSLIFLDLQILLPLLFLSGAANAGVNIYLIVPLPIPSVMSLVELVLVSRCFSGRPQQASGN